MNIFLCIDDGPSEERGMSKMDSFISKVCFFRLFIFIFASFCWISPIVMISINRKFAPFHSKVVRTNRIMNLYNEITERMIPYHFQHLNHFKSMQNIYIYHVCLCNMPYACGLIQSYKWRVKICLLFLSLALSQSVRVTYLFGLKRVASQNKDNF